MIDFIKLYWRDKCHFEAFVCNQENFKDLYSVLNQHSGEISYPYRTSLGCMNITVNEKSANVRNSLHKLHNVILGGKEHNHNDFTYSMLCSTIDYLYCNLIDVNSASITQMEFGLNIETEIQSEVIIRKNFLMHKLKGFNHNREYHGKGQLKQFDHSNYVIKVYDKAKQYSIKDKNILRFELKFLKQKEFQNLGIINLQDLKCKVKLRRLFDLLLQRFDELTIIDEIADSSSILKEDRINLLEYMTPTFWEEKLNGVHTQIKSRHRDKFNSILDKYDLLKTKRVLRDALVNKFNYLIDN